MSIKQTLRFISSHPLNRGQEIRSIARFLKWQIRSRLASEAIVFEWVNGSRFLVKSGETGLTGNIYTGLHEFSDMAFVLHALRAGDLFVDVGANSGSYSILACAAVGARGVAFEPGPEAYSRLIRNMRLNCLTDRVKCINKAVGDQEGPLNLTNGCDTTNHALAPGEICDKAISVRMTSLDAELRDESPLLMKIDVEGYEEAVLNGASTTLTNQSLQSVIVELNDRSGCYGFDESRVLRMMWEYGFKTYSYDPLSRKLTELEGKNRESGNTLFVRDRQVIEDRLRSARSVTIHGRSF